MSLHLQNMRGALLMMGSMTAFTMNDACLKALSVDMPLAQILFLRGAATTILMVALGLYWGNLRLDFGRRDAGLIALRSLTEVAAAFFFISALINMPIANAIAILQALPLSVTLAAALAFREPLGWRRLTAIGIGFLGVLLIVRPGTEGFNLYSVYALAAVVVVTIRDLVVRSMSATVPSMTIAAAGAFAVCIFGLIWSFFVEWAPVTGQATALISGSVVFIIVAYILSVAVMRVGEIGFIAPFRYTSLVVALIVGFLVFGEWPDPLTLVGASIVVATGLFTLWRARQSHLAQSRNFKVQ